MDYDPKKLISESFKINAITDVECRSIFFGWALAVDENSDPIKLIGEKCLKVWAKKNRKYLKKGSIKSTRNFFGVRYSGNLVLIQDYLKSMIKERREEDIEVNFHPAHITQSLLNSYPGYKNGNSDFDILNKS